MSLTSQIVALANRIGQEIKSIKTNYVLSSDSRLSNARPANGGNSDTVDGKHASDFALTGDARLSDARTPSNDSDLVHKSGNESIAGIKKFTDTVQMSDGTNGCNMKYNTVSKTLDFIFV